MARASNSGDGGGDFGQQSHVLWQDLEELVEKEQLSCCGSPSYPQSISRPENLTATLLTRDGGASKQLPVCSSRAVHMSNSSFLLGLSILILAAGAILLAISTCQWGRLWPWGPLCPSTGGGCPQEGDCATLLFPQGDGQGKQRWIWRRRFRAAEPCNAVSPLCGPWRCRPGCTDCIKAAQELQELVLSAWAGRGAAAALDAGTWQVLWQDLEELVEKEQLSCCGSPSYPKSISRPENLTATHLTRDGGAPMEERSVCFLDHTCPGRVSSALKTHVAQKALEIRMGAPPMPVQQSQEQAAQQQGCLRVLPKLILPGQSQPLLRHDLCPAMQAKANATMDKNEEKEVRRPRGDPNATKESLALQMLCPPPLLGFLVPKLPKERRAGEPMAPGNASAVGQHKAGQQEPQSPHGSEEKPAIQAPEEDTLRKSLLHLGRGLSPWDKEYLSPFDLATAPPPLPSLDNRAAGPEAGAASMLLKKDAACQMNIPTQGTGQAHAEDRTSACATASSRKSTLQLNQEVHSKLLIHTARKCPEIKLQTLPKAAQKSTGMLRCSQPRRRQAGAGNLLPNKCSAHVAKAKQLRQKEWVLQEQVQASLTCTVLPMTPCSCLYCVSSCSPVPGEESSQAFLEARTLPRTSCSSGNEMGTDTKDAPRTPCGMVKDSPGPASTLVSPGLVQTFPAVDTKPEKAQGAHMCSTHEGFMVRAPGAPQSHCCCCKKQARPDNGSFPSGIDPLKSSTSREGNAASKRCGTWSQGTPWSTERQRRWTPDGLSQGRPPKMDRSPNPCCPEGIPSQHSPSSQQHCGSSVTRNVSSCQPCPAPDAQDTAAASTRNTLRAVLERIRQRRRKVS
ncbi:uncharacterized protein LOC133210949 [Neopsephotus bourkii]|uniref:uncharacterized protein LOC133210949 n=1 Tax=Neopsephotus bourkii TaxID=309878 RepID=UPI002AA4F93E|nr:uncharacterized protein LOC133210949 [Neopsephotus bourkii]